MTKKTTSPEQQAQAIAEVKAGTSRKDVADKYGVHLQTVHLWMQKDKLVSLPAQEPEWDTELLLLRQENEHLKREIETLRKLVAAYEKLSN